MSNSCQGRILAAALFVFAFAGTATAGTEVVRIEGVSAPVKVTRDADGIAHIKALRSQDLYFVQGYVHAQDRLFQMDITRRQPSGTLAELFGPRALAGDVEARTIGLRRAAERSMPALTRRTREALKAYADGVNRWVAENPLPPEYDALNIGFEPWTPVDSVVIAKAIAFSLSFDLDTGPTESFRAYAETLGPQLGSVAFFEDVFRSMPFDCASTVPDATGEYPFLALGDPDQVPNCLSDSVTVPPHVADGVREQLALRVVTHELRIDHDTGQAVAVHRQPGPLLLGEAETQGHGLVGAALVEAAAKRFQVVLVHGDEFAQGAERPLEVRHAFAHEGQDMARLVGRQQRAVAIVDEAALGRQRLQLDPVAFRLRAVGLVTGDLQVEIAQEHEEQRREHGKHRDRCAAAKDTQFPPRILQGDCLRHQPR